MTELNIDNIIPLLRKRENNTHKGDFGTLLSFVGSSYYRGAAVLSSLGALKSGVGILRVCCNECVADSIISAAPEATLYPKSGNVLDISGFEAEKIFSEIRPSAALCGCGITERESAVRCVKSVINSCNTPLLLDASALNILSKHPSILKSAHCRITITPHIGEFARLSGFSVADIKASPEKYASEFASRHGLCVVLKDYFTLICTPEGDVYRSDFGNSGLSRGGSGDILAGIIASLLSQGLSQRDSAICGVVLHGFSADLCAKRLSKTAMLPHDILTDLSDIFLKYGL